MHRLLQGLWSARFRVIQESPLKTAVWQGKVDVRLPGKGDFNSRSARPVHLIITMIKWIQTSRLSINTSLSVAGGKPPEWKERSAAILRTVKDLEQKGYTFEGADASVDLMIRRSDPGQFRGGLVFQAHRRLYHSTLGLRVIKKKKNSSHESWSNTKRSD